MKNIIAFKSVFVLVLIAVSFGCHKKTPVNPPVNAAPVTEAPPPGPPVCTLTGDPATITQGQSVTLSWTSSNATGVDIEPGLAKQLAQGSTTVQPQSSTTYVLTATGPGGSTSCTARVTVTPAAPQSPSVSEENLGGTGAAGVAALQSQIQDVFFDYDAADLRSDAQQILTADAAALKGHPEVSVTVEGHCDERGSEEYNLGLGQRRADAAKNFLVSLGIAADHVSTVSYGKDRPFCTEDSESCWSKNRRDHFALK